MSTADSSSQTDAKLIDFLSNPDSYPHKPKVVKHVQTHIFMAGKYVYKIKKPVNFDFLDYSTLEKRKHFCEREIELNKRLCEDTYLGVTPILASDDSYQFGDENSDNTVEYAVKMEKLKDEFFLHNFIDEGKLTHEHLDRVADKLAAFYLAQDPDREILEYGKLEKVKYNTNENFEQTEQFIGNTIREADFKAIKQFTNGYFSCCKSLFERRIKQKRIVDGHGDLHLEHIHMAPDKVRIYDCIEFNDRFRYGDVAADLAFLAMDLDFNNCRAGEHYFINQMEEKLDDADLPKHINFYKCYRAYVKGKVKSFKWAEQDDEEKERQKAGKIAKAYFNLALKYALLGSKPMAIILMGRTGTGKSTLAKKLSEKLNIDHYSSDRMRKSMINLPLYERPDAEERAKLYSKKMSDKTYVALLDKAKEQLKAMNSVILDATFSKKEDRQKIIDLLQKEVDVDYCFIEAKAMDEIIKKRLKARQEGSGSISDARLEDFDMLNDAYESPDELDEAHYIAVNTGQSIESTKEELYDKLVNRQLQTVASSL